MMFTVQNMQTEWDVNERKILLNAAAIISINCLNTSKYLNNMKRGNLYILRILSIMFFPPFQYTNDFLHS